MKKRLMAILCVLLNIGILIAQDKPNIVIIISDDHSYQSISAYGSTLAQTPHIDRLAEEGAILNKAYVTNSICGPSRAVLLTGKYSHKNGFKDNVASVFDHGQDLFVKRLREAGYQTAWIGKQHLGNKPQGFDYYSILPGQGQYYNPDFINSDGNREHIEGYVTNIITDKAEEWLEKREDNDPFCLIIGHKATHRTWIPDTADFGLFDDHDFPLPDNYYDNYENRLAAQRQEMSIEKDMRLGYDLKMLSPEEGDQEATVKRMNAEQRAKFDAYYGPIHQELKEANLSGKELAEWKYQRYLKDYLSTAASMDRNIGRVLDYLDKNNLTDNTLVIYISDQGFYMGEHGWFDKRFMYEESFRTPMLARLPGKIPAGSQVDGFVMNTDIAPTVLELAGIRIPNDMQGVSILDMLSQKTDKVRDDMYYHYYEAGGGHNVSPHFGIRTDRYKLIRFYESVNAWELYDLEKDPQEMHNIYEKRGTEALTKDLKQRLEKQIQELEDDEALEILNTSLKKEVL